MSYQAPKTYLALSEKWQLLARKFLAFIADRDSLDSRQQVCHELSLHDEAGQLLAKCFEAGYLDDVLAPDLLKALGDLIESHSGEQQYSNDREASLVRCMMNLWIEFVGNHQIEVFPEGYVGRTTGGILPQVPGQDIHTKIIPSQIAQIPADQEQVIHQEKTRWGNHLREQFAHACNFLAEAIHDMKRLKASAEENKSDVSNVAEDGGEAEATKPAGPTSKSEKRSEWLAKAMLIVRDFPHLSNAEIARQVGKDNSTLSRSKEYQAAAEMARGAKNSRHRGHITVDADSGLRGVEAYSDDPAERDWED